MTGRKKHDYPNEIIDFLRKDNNGHSKNSIAHKIGGDRNEVFEAIRILIGRNFLQEKKGKMYMDFDMVGHFKDVIDEFEDFHNECKAMIFGDEKRDGYLFDIRKILKKSKNPMFYAEEVVIQGVKQEGVMHQINPEIKSHLQAIREILDRLTRTAHGLLVMNLWNRYPSQEIDKFEKLMKSSTTTQIKTRNELKKMIPKKNQHMFTEWEFQVFAGLVLGKKKRD